MRRFPFGKTLHNTMQSSANELSKIFQQLNNFHKLLKSCRGSDSMAKRSRLDRVTTQKLGVSAVGADV